MVRDHNYFSIGHGGHQDRQTRGKHRSSLLSVLSGHRTDQENTFNSQCKVGAPVLALLRGVLIFEGKLGWSRTERLTLASINQETS